MNCLFRVVRARNYFEYPRQNINQFPTEKCSLSLARRTDLVMKRRFEIILLPNVGRTRHYSVGPVKHLNNKYLQKSIFNAIQENDAKKLRLALDMGADANKPGYITKFGFALDWSRVLLELTALGPLAFFIDTPSSVVTPLMVAAKEGHVECAKILLEYGANIYFVDKNSKTAALIAYENGHYELAKLLNPVKRDE